MKEKLKTYVLNSLWIYKNILPFFIGILASVVVIATALSCLFLLNAKKVNGKVLNTDGQIDARHDDRFNEKIISVGYTVDSTAASTTLTVQSDKYKIGDTVPLQVAGKQVKINSWYDLFGIPIVSFIFMIILIACYRLLSKLKYDPKRYDGTIFKMGKRYD